MLVDAARRRAGWRRDRRRCSPARASAERGLGGDDVDLAERLTGFAPGRARRARGRAPLAPLARGGRSGRGRRRRRPIRPRPAPCWRSPFRTASPGPAAAAPARSCSPMAAPPRSIRRRALAREPWLAVAEIGGTAGAARILSAAAISRRDRAPAVRGRDHGAADVTFDAASGTAARPPAARLGAIAFDERALPVPPAPRPPRILARGARARASKACLEQPSAPAARPRRLPAPGRARHLAGPLRRRPRGAIRWRGLARPASHRPDGAVRASMPTASGRRSAALLPYPLPARLEREAPTHFEAPTGSRVADRLRRRGTRHRDPRAGTVRPDAAPRGRRPPAGHRAALARPPARANDARPARLLARLLRGRARRDARPLSPPSLARGPGARDPTTRGQAARHLIVTILTICCNSSRSPSVHQIRRASSAVVSAVFDLLGMRWKPQTRTIPMRFILGFMYG